MTTTVSVIATESTGKRKAHDWTPEAERDATFRCAVKAGVVHLQPGQTIGGQHKAERCSCKQFFGIDPAAPKDGPIFATYVRKCDACRR